jgi:hypothetical protein
LSFELRRDWTSAVASLLFLLLIAQACSPSQSFRPGGSLLPGRSHELGIAISNIEPRPYVEESAQRLGQAWWMQQLSERWLFTTLVAFDTSAVLGGTALRWDAFPGSRLAVSPELELGLFWAAASLPMTLRLWHGTGIYTSPRLGNWGAEVTPFLPIGVTSELFHGLVLRAEAQLSWANFQYYNRRVHWGFAVAHQW